MLNWAFYYPSIHCGILQNTDIKKHFSAVQPPEQVLLGLACTINHLQFHCSPLMSRHKGGTKRRIVLDLSYPRGGFVNDFVDRQCFDNSEFMIKCPHMNKIIRHIKTTGGLLTIM